MKACCDCHITKPLSDFHPRKPRCKECRSKQEKARRQDPTRLQRERELRRAWYYSGGKEKVRVNTAKFREQHAYPGWSDPSRKKTRTATQTAIRRGKLKRQPCEVCGAPNVHAHHDDYSKPLDVRWLCLPCHHAHHHPNIRALAPAPREDAT